MKGMLRNASVFLFIAGFLVSLTPLFSSSMALGAGVLLGISMGHPFTEISRKGTRWLLQISVVGLGAGMNLSTVLQAGTRGFFVTAVNIAAILTAGHILGRLLKLDAKLSSLLNAGTAICGGSAIAAVSPVIRPQAHQISIALAVVFILNALGLFLFPWLGHLLNLNEAQFGLWAALAIHDTSSVVGASALYGEHALEVGTTTKLVRALWIIPLAFVMGRLHRDQSGAERAQIPWFVFGFLAVSALVTWIPVLHDTGEAVAGVSRHLLNATLFLIGAGLTRESLKEVGARPLLHGVLLWIFAALIGLGITLSSSSSIL